MKIDWEKVGGLLPAVVQESASGEVLMLAYMNKEALNLSLKTGFAHYFSRTKNRIWKKGEESGNVQKVKQAYLDCDNDTLLIKVEQIGGIACHTGQKSCFFREVNFGDNADKISVQNANFNPNSDIEHKTKPTYDIIDEIYHIILDRKFNADPKTSYVASLFKKGENAILKKVGEEATELVMACKDASKFEGKNIDKNDFVSASALVTENFTDEKQESQNAVIYEAADLCFHALIALAQHGIHPELVKKELARRFGRSGIDEKNSRSEK